MPPQIFGAASDYADELSARAERAERALAELKAEVDRLRAMNLVLIDALSTAQREFLDPWPDGSWAETMARIEAALKEAQGL